MSRVPVSAGPIFVVGAPRSGTSLMRLILNAHSRIAIPEETNYFPSVFEPWQEKAEDGDSWPQAVNTYLSASSEFLHPPVDLNEVRATLLGSPRDFAQLLSLPLESWARSQGKVRWGEKTPTHIFFADVIVRMFPDARFAELIRDPRSTVASMNRFHWASDDTVLNACWWRDSMSKGRRLLLSAVPDDRRISVRYEQLVTEPELVIRNVCRFLGEAYESTMLSFNETASRYVKGAYDPKLLQPISAGPDWHNSLTRQQVAMVEAICGTEMEDLGYERTGIALSRREKAAAQAKPSYVAWKHWQHRTQRYHPVMYRPGSMGELRRLGTALLTRPRGDRE